MVVLSAFLIQILIIFIFLVIFLINSAITQKDDPDYQSHSPKPEVTAEGRFLMDKEPIMKNKTTNTLIQSLGNYWNDLLANVIADWYYLSMKMCIECLKPIS